MTDSDFDQARKRRQETSGFIIGGERFQIRDVSFHDIEAWQDSPSLEKSSEQNKQTISFISEFIVDEDLPRWETMLERKKGEDPLTVGDLLALARWLMEQHTARPTVQPSPSGRGPVKLPSSSGGVASSRVVTPTG